jgi:DNA-binding CsgD family transcriptional regulator
VTATNLTFSERRTAALAAEGLRNPQIAQRLHVTPSTVEQHLTRAYRKLGCRRDGLRAALSRIDTRDSPERTAP